MTMMGGEPPIDWAALAPHIEHPARESIVAAIRWIGPLSVRDLKGVLDGPEFHLSYLVYHVTALAREGALIEVEKRPTGASTESLYYFMAPK